MVRAAAIILAVPYGMALLIGNDLSGPALLLEFMTDGTPEALGLLNPMAAIVIAVAVALRHSVRSEPAGPNGR